jgi:ribosomal protein S18 acetylase RimI-like enzyme
MDIRPLTREDEEALSSFFQEIPDADHAFFKEQLDDPAVLRRWLTDERVAAVWPGIGRSSHVGDLRVVVAAGHRRQGLGQSLSRHALVEALRRDMKKVVVEVVADQQGTLDMFQQLGFEPEALLRDQLRDADGQFHDVVLLAHAAEETWSEMLTAGLDRDGA